MVALTGIGLDIKLKSFTKYISASVKITFSSPLIKVAPFLVTTQEFGEGISGVSFMITVEPDITPGDYSVFVNGKNGPISCLIGALSVE